jgi:2-phosphosulfolactate phosphatase
MPTLHVLCKKESLDPQRLGGHVVIVLDILFATSTIVHAFGEGVESVWPAMDRDEAAHIAAGMSNCVRAGEYLAEPLPGFASAAPLMLGREALRGNALVYCTTNGTVALRRAADAAFVYAGALLNGAALVAHIACAHPGAPVLVVCAGSVGHFNLEDFYGAGHIVSHFEKYPGYEMNDAAAAAMLLYRGCDAHTALLSSRVGRMMRQRSLQHEVEYAARRDTLDVVPRLQGTHLKRVDA